MNYPDSVYIYSAATTDTDTGSATTLFTLRETACSRVQPVSNREATRAGITAGDTAYTFYFESDITLTIKDRIEYNSNTYEIVELVVYPNTYKKAIGRIII